ncbi:cytochrome c biogenesis protein CcsA [Acidipila sp. EB88]|uniref:cytochrome c biogenesis protein CcsA n=1 Tax=Acidipila sp. EB88 TaxID=2305226 RepID=UPI001F2BEA09|nr:cytochrome c biogenesis protein CcsA [Acidipila sp. EB88]
MATAMYGVASLCALPAVLWNRARFRTAALALACSAAVLQCVVFAGMAAAHHRFIPTGTHEVQAALGLLIAAAFLLIAARYRTISFGLFALPMAFLLALPSALGPDHYTFSSPLARGGWIAIHVASLLAADTALVFSLLASFLYLLQERRLKDKHAPGFFAWLPPLDTMDRIAQSTLVLGFLCMTLGLFAGSLIAQERVGATYFQDPKVVLSFAMWLIYVSILLVRQSKGLRGRQAMYVSTIAFLVVLSVWAANLFSSVHRFAAP